MISINSFITNAEGTIFEKNVRQETRTQNSKIEQNLKINNKYYFSVVQNQRE